jgi:hypothetical protein
MTNRNIYRFDPSTYDAKLVHKPLAQLMREAEIERAKAAHSLFSEIWRSITALFGARQSETPPAQEHDRRLAA